MRATICDYCKKVYDKPYAEVYICVGKDVPSELHFCLNCLNEGVTIKRKQNKALPPGGPNGLN